MTAFKGNYTKYMNAGIAMFDGITFGFGAGDWATAGENGAPDFQLAFDGTQLALIPDAADSIVRFGNMNATTTDVQFSGSATANFMEWDASVNALEFNGAGGIVMGASTSISTVGTGAIKGSDIIIPFNFSANDAGEVISNSGVCQASFQAPFAMTITETCISAHGTVTTGDSASLTVEVLEGGTSIMTAGVEIPSEDTCTITAPAAGGIADNAKITVEITADASGEVTTNGDDNASISVVLTGERA